ncbi:hypothetical protein PUN28_010985 [Cardiocondyla obscurior]|uniref:Uncharacterized protein n=1 Tax=Cardiocondyla obscurior TaxID=286306 RepID=A0AAW2FL47_9HYME
MRYNSPESKVTSLIIIHRKAKLNLSLTNLPIRCFGEYLKQKKNNNCYKIYIYFFFSFFYAYLTNAFRDASGPRTHGMLISSLEGVRQFGEENPSRKPCETDVRQRKRERNRER